MKTWNVDKEIRKVKAANRKADALLKQNEVDSLRANNVALASELDLHKRWWREMQETCRKQRTLIETLMEYFRVNPPKTSLNPPSELEIDDNSWRRRVNRESVKTTVSMYDVNSAYPKRE
jgi:hypothetical protein